MNNRIDDLIKLATEYTDDPEELYFDRYKFAQLIIDACLAQADRMSRSMHSDGQKSEALGAEWAAIAIARYFGLA